MMPPADPDCDFCDIVARQDPDVREIFRTDLVVAFFPLEPATLGHTLLVPRAHIPDIWGLDAETAAELGRRSVRIAEAVRRAMAPDGLNVIQSNGEAATQTIMHLHVHIVPRWHNDSIGQIWPPSSQWTETQKNQAWEALKEEFRRPINA